MSSEIVYTIIVVVASALVAANDQLSKRFEWFERKYWLSIVLIILSASAGILLELNKKESPSVTKILPYPVYKSADISNVAKPQVKYDINLKPVVAINQGTHYSPALKRVNDSVILFSFQFSVINNAIVQNVYFKTRGMDIYDGKYSAAKKNTFKDMQNNTNAISTNNPETGELRENYKKTDSCCIRVYGYYQLLSGVKTYYIHDFIITNDEVSDALSEVSQDTLNKYLKL